MLNSKITGETMIFRNEKGFYSTSISKGRKNAEGKTEYDNTYINVGFKKGVDIPNKTKINIINGWLTFDKYEKDGNSTSYFKIFVSDYEIVGENSTTNNEVFGADNEDDLPF